jgi:hypothetical protein
MARNVDRTRWETWQRRISKQQGSGLSIVEFCRREGISQGCFQLPGSSLDSSLTHQD